MATVAVGAAVARDGDGAGRAAGVSSLAEARRSAAKELERRRTPEARAQRRRSRTAFAGLTGSRAVGLGRRTFPDALDRSLPAGLRLGKGERVEKYLGRFAARIATPKGEPAGIAVSTVPLRAPNGHGKQSPVNLDLAAVGNHFESRNPAVEVAYSKNPREGVTLVDSGVGVSLAGLSRNVGAREEADRLVVPDAVKDTDLWATPTVAGFQTFALLRSAASPQALTFQLRLPRGSRLKSLAGGGAEVRRSGKQLVSISTPIAVDADGVAVPVSMQAKGSAVVLRILHRASDVHYPVLVDPQYTEEGWNWIGTPWKSEHEPEAYGWTTYTNHSGAFDAAPLYLPGRWGGGLYTFTREGFGTLAGDYTDWRFNPPGTTTKIYRVEMVGSAQLYNGCWRFGISDGSNASSCSVSIAENFWTFCQTETCDPNAGTGDNYALFHLESTSNVQRVSSNKMIGALGYAVVRYSDSDLPTFEAVNSGGSSAWVKSFNGEISGPIRDNGVGMLWQQASISESSWIDGYEEPCEGTWYAPCPRDMPTGYPISDAELPEGKHTVLLEGEDALGQKASKTWGNIWLDRKGPNVEPLSGTLWEKSDKPNAEGKATAEAKTLPAGSYTLKIPATDGVVGGKESEQRSGVKSVEVQVDGETALAPDSVSCPAGSCPDTREWTFKTADFPAGTRTITVVAKDQIGNQTSKSLHVVVPPAGELELPLAGAKTSRWVQLKAHADATGYSTVRFQFREAGGTWANIPLAAMTDTAGKSLSSIELPISGSVSPIVDFEVGKAFGTPPAVLTQVQVRGVFTGTGGGTSKAVPITFDPRGLTTDDARTPIGPGEVNLATGNFNFGATDASVGSWGTSIAVSRALNSRNPGSAIGPFGPGWTLSTPVEGASEYVSLGESTDAYGSQFIELKVTGGEAILFYLEGGKYVPEAGYETMALTKPSAEEFSLKEDSGITVVFKKQSGTSGNLYVPTQVQQSVSANTSSVAYDVVSGVPRVATILAPVPSGVSCTSLNTPGCRSLKLVYATATTAKGTGEAEWGNYKDRVEKIELTAYDPVTSAMKTDPISQYLYDNSGRLRAQWDPRVSPSLKTRYTYDGWGRLTTVAPPGESAWTMTYAALSGDGDGGRLKSVGRETPQGVATTTVVYQVPLSGSGAPNQMSPEAVAAWGQKDVPVGATAIFPPDTVPSEPPASWTRAGLHYLDANGREVNSAASGVGVSTSEYDVYGNVVRALSPANRARALAAGGESVALSEKLDSQSKFENKGTEMVEQLGPEHQIKLANGETVRARARTTIAYDEGAPAEKDPHLPTKTTVQAKVSGGAENADAKVTKTEYDWTLLQPTKVTKDYGGLNIVENTTYVASTGLVEGTYKPKYPKPAESAGTPDRRTIYFSATENKEVPACGNKAAFANLPCKIQQPVGYGEVPVTFFDYNRLNEVTAKTEEVSDRTRTTTTTYDAAGRQLTSRVGSSTDAEDLALAYGFEETSGTSTLDKSGNGNTGTLENVSRVTYGRFGRGLDFDSTDKLSVPHSASLVPNGAITMEAWLRPDVASTNQPIFSKPGSTGCASPSYFLRASTSAASPQPQVGGCATYFSASSTYKLPVGMWSHLAATIDASKNAKIYVNGELIASGTVTASPGASIGSLVIGSGFDGLIDEVRVYTRALSSGEIHSDMSMAVDGSASPPSVPVKSGLIAAYGFEELPSAGSTLIDSSSLGNNGTYGTFRTGGRFGAAIPSGEATVNHTTALSVGKAATFEMWVYSTQNLQETRPLLELGSGGGSWKIGTINSSTYYAWAGSVPNATGTGAVALNRPQHLAVTYDGTSVKIYVDGSLKATGSASGTVDSKTLKLKPPPSGRLDEVRIYSRALTQAEVKEDSETPVVLPQSSMTNGNKLPVATTGYSSTTGRPVTLSTTEEGTTRTLTTEYDSVGRAIGYQDADGVTSTTKFDLDGRTTEVSDGKGTQSYGYDASTGQLTSLVDSQAGTFTAKYDTTGQLSSQTYPGGMESHLAYDETGDPESLSYTKPGCSTCVWYEQDVSSSIAGQWLTNTTTVADHSYTYDGIGRLTFVRETPTGKGCTTREYAYDADSNRTSRTTREPGAGGVCVTSGAGAQQTSTYDAADRITGTGFRYDSWGRLLEVPASHSGGGALAMTYYVNDMTRTSVQDGKSVGWLLDPTQTRQRATITNETKQTIYHYSDGSDSPAWTADFTGISMTGWQRPVGAIDGSLGALVNNNGTTTSVALQLTNLHGDVVGTATTSPEATKPTELFEADEFGGPVSSSKHEYGWLGAKERRTTLESGLVQMGVRSYVPTMGRFTTVDPVFGGSANSYDYANQDPLNAFDLDGRDATKCYTYSESRTRRGLVGNKLHAKISASFEWCSKGGRIVSHNTHRSMASGMGWGPDGGWDVTESMSPGNRSLHVTVSRNFKVCASVPKVGSACVHDTLTIDMIFKGDGFGGYDVGRLARGRREDGYSDRVR
jgi:RHS repeat-associated protein